MTDDLDALLARVRACARCEGLPLGPRPILQASASARILVAGQAPGKRTHHGRVPFDDPSGDRLRDWLGVDRGMFYDPARFAVVPMGFCFPGSGRNGDLPPRAECAPAWREEILARLPEVRLTLVVGQYALDWHLPGPTGRRRAVSEAVAAWRERWPEVLPLPHPSPRNNRWLKEHPWFETEVLPALRGRVAELLAD
ncbi:MAG: uracil-DNA glycosylase family protein [Dehalococcoidia bacterium]